MIRLPPRSTRLTHSFPTRRASDLPVVQRPGDIALAFAARRHLVRQLLDTRSHRSLRHGTNAVGVGNARVISERGIRSEEHTSELQSLMRISYAVFCLKKKKQVQNRTNKHRVTYHNTQNYDN